MSRCFSAVEDQKLALLLEPPGRGIVPLAAPAEPLDTRELQAAITNWLLG